MEVMNWSDREEYRVDTDSVTSLIMRGDWYPEIDFEGMEEELDSIAVRGIN